MFIMSIIKLPFVLPGQVGNGTCNKSPLITTDNLATITTAGYLNSSNLEGYPISSSDVLNVYYSYNQQTDSGTYGIFTVSITDGVITLVQWINPGNVLLPVVDGDLASFDGTDGQIKDSTIASNRVQTSLFNTPSASANLIPFDIAPSYATLGSGGKVNLITAATLTAEYRIRVLVMGTGSNFSGGGGDRLGRITDGTTVFSVVPEADMQSLSNAYWGSTALPFPASNVPNAKTQPGANLYFEYQGGTTDYTAGILGISGLLERTA